MKDRTELSRPAGRQPLGTAEVVGVVLSVGELLLLPMTGALLLPVPGELLPPVPVAVLADGEGLAVGDEFGVLVLVLALGLGLAGTVGAVLAGAEGVAVADGWLAAVVAGGAAVELAELGAADTVVGVARLDVVHDGDGVARGDELARADAVACASVPVVAAGVVNGMADAIAEDLGFTTPAPTVDPAAPGLAVPVPADAHPVTPMPPPAAVPEFPCGAVLAPSSDDRPPCRTPFPVRVLVPPPPLPSTAVVCPPVSTAELACTIA